MTITHTAKLENCKKCNFWHFKKDVELELFFLPFFITFEQFVILSYFQADHLAANRTSENILKTVGSEKKVVGAQVLKKKSGDDAVQVSLNDYRYQNLRITNLFTVWSSDTRFLVQEKNLCCLRSKIV